MHTKQAADKPPQGPASPPNFSFSAVPEAQKHDAVRKVLGQKP